MGQNVTFTASVAALAPGAGAPTGMVSFRDGSTVIGTAAVSGGQAVLTVALSSVGNHEFDDGKDELLRMQNGGCHPEGCKGPHPFEGAKFHYLAASTFLKDSGKTLFPPYEIRTFDGVPVAFIGLTLKGTAGIISPASAAGLEFGDEVSTVNALVPELKAKGLVVNGFLNEVVDRLSDEEVKTYLHEQIAHRLRD